MHKLVFDTSAILNFGKRGELEFLLERLAEAQALLTTREVERELSDPDNRPFYGALLKRHFKLHEAQNVKIELVELKRLARLLGAGELSVILSATDLSATAVLDEKVARLEAKKLKIKVTGTLGILDEAIKRKWCADSRCIEIVARLHAAGFRIRRPGANETFAEYFETIRK
jgi:predicted nucleic acid-binding protein